ncbi:MAG: FMN-binding protein [Lachnospiraceae bacterium]|nr:FMN-binding protein [Lachnospiraceae bacterium]
MKKRKLSAKVLSGSLAAAMAVSMLPAVPALAVTGSQVAADGTYTSSSYDVISNDEDWEEDYAVTVSLTVEDGVFSDITVTPNETYDPDVNGTYFEKAYSKSKGIKTLLEGQAATEDTINSWDTVSNATVTSTAVKAAALEAIQSAPEASEEGEYVYVTMNIPYDDFFNAVDADAEQAEEYTDALDGVDVVSYATSKYGLTTDDDENPVGTRVTSGTAKGTYNDGESVKGVYYAVQMDENTYKALKDSALTEGDDYYFTALDEEPESYLVLTYADDTYTFDASGLTTVLTEEAEIADLTYTSTYGDYMFSLMNVEQKGVTDADGNSDIQIDGESVTIAVEILEFSDGNTLAMYNVDNIWMGSRYDHEISWSIVGGKGYYKGHNNSSNPLYYQYTMTDYTLTGVKVITDRGIYNFTCEQTLLPYYNGDGEITATAEDGDTEVSVSVPDELQDVTVTVTYSYKAEGSYRATTYTIADEVAIVDGKVALDEAIDQATYGDYTITISSSNYAPTSITLEAPMTEAQKAELESLMETAKALLEEVDHSMLAEHVEEAEELLNNAAATSGEATELIEELTTYIAEAEAMMPVYVTMNIPYDDFFNAVDADAEQAEEYTDALDGVDVVSYATSKYGLSTDDDGNAVGKRVTSGTAKGTYNDGESVKGVYYAVKMTTDAYAALADSELTEGDDYYFTDLDETPESYLTLSYADGVYTFDADGLTTALTEEAEIADLTYTSTYGDYMFSLMNVEQKGVTDAEGNSDIQIDGESVTIAVEILEFSDGSTLAMYNVDNIWMGSRYDHEISWSIVGGKGYYKGHNNSSNPLYYQYTMTDYTLSAVRVITDKGIYEFTCSEELLPYYNGDGEISATAEDGDTEVTVSVPDELQDVTVTVTYSYKAEGSYRATTYTIADGVAVVDGKVALDEAIDQATYGDYTITISSSNYAPVTITLEAPMTETQRAQLEELVAEANALLAIADHSLLAEHVEEAEALLESAAPTSGEATELLDEMPAYIEEARALAVTALEELVADAETLTESDYTEESWAALQTALEAANEALADEDVADVVVDVYTDLKEAIDALVLVQTSNDTLIVRRGNTFFVSYELESGDADLSFTYGRETDEVLIGDWDGDGIDTICVRRGNRYYFSNTLGGQADYYIDYGKETDEVIAGDWDGDGIDTLCVRRGNWYYISNTLESGYAEQEFTFGKVTDAVISGDWDGDGYDTLCIRRGNWYYINNTLEGGNAKISFTFGRTNDVVLAGDWDGDGSDTLCIRRGNVCFINNTLEGGNAELEFTFGRTADEVYAGTWQ